MGKHYTQLTFEERCEVARLLAAKTSQRKIATAQDRQAQGERKPLGTAVIEMAANLPRYGKIRRDRKPLIRK